MDYDVGIIGAGVSGAFAALRLAEKYKNIKAIVFEYGPPPPNCLRQDPIRVKRRRRQLEGWLGCFPTGDGRVYMEEDINKISEIVDGRKLKSINKWFSGVLDEVGSDIKINSSKNPISSILKQARENGFEFITHSYQHWCPDQIHQLAKIVSERIEGGKNVTLSFDTEVFNIMKNGKGFDVTTSQGNFKCGKIILCSGRTGWRWVNNLYKTLGMTVEDDTSVYGIKIEMPSSNMKDFNKSHCSFVKEGTTIGPLQWFGSIIQEDHADVTVSAFRSNEDRWKTDRVFFSLKRAFQNLNNGVGQAERMAKLAFLLSGDRVGREKIKTLMKKTSAISLLPDYSWVYPTLEEISPIFPNLLARGYFHVADIDAVPGKISLANNLETEIDGLFVAGENAGVKGIAAAGLMGAIAAEGVAK